jgi:hypothetical protein
VDRFKCGKTTLDDEELSCQLLTSQTDDQCAKMNAVIKGNKQIIVSETALTADICYAPALVIVHHDLSYHEVCAKWVPRQLMEEHKTEPFMATGGLLTQTQPRWRGPVATNCHR